MLVWNLTKHVKLRDCMSCKFRPNGKIEWIKLVNFPKLLPLSFIKGNEGTLSRKEGTLSTRILHSQFTIFVEQNRKILKKFNGFSKKAIFQARKTSIGAYISAHSKAQSNNPYDILRDFIRIFVMIMLIWTYLCVYES